MNESRKVIRAANLLDDAHGAITGAISAIFQYEKKIKELEPLAGLSEVADEITAQVKTLRRVARAIDKPKSKRCPRTCPQLCPKHKQLKIGG